MKRSNEKNISTRPCRVLLGSVFFICLVAICFVNAIKISVVEASSESESILSTCSNDTKNIKLKFSIRQPLAGKPLQNPFKMTNEEIELVNEDNEKTKGDANIKQKTTNNNDEKVNKNILPEIRGVLWGKKPKAIVFYRGEIYYLSEKDEIAGCRVIRITKDEVKGNGDFNWRLK